MRARSITVQRLGGRHLLICPTFAFKDKIYGTPLYESGIKLFPFKNLSIYGFYDNTKTQYIPEGYKVNIQADYTAVRYLYKNSNVILKDERVSPYFNESGYYFYRVQQSETQIPILITHGLHDIYYFYKYHNADNSVRIRPSPETSSKPITFDYSKSDDWSYAVQFSAPLFFENYMDITIIVSNVRYFGGSLVYNSAPYIFVRNCSRIRYIDGNNPTAGLPEGYGVKLEFTGTVNADVSSDTLTTAVYKEAIVRFDKSIKGTNTRFATTTYYECRPTMKNLTLGPNNIIVDSIFRCINCTLYGNFEFRYAKGTYSPLLYLQNCSLEVTSIKVVIYSDSYLTGFSSAKILDSAEILESAYDDKIIISGLNPETASEVLKKVKIVKEEDGSILTHKAILTKDSKGILIVPISFQNGNAPDVPSKYDPDNPDNYGNEDRIEDEFYTFEDESDKSANKDDESGDDFVQLFELNPSPPPAPTSSPSLSPLPTETPSETPTKTPINQGPDTSSASSSSSGSSGSSSTSGSSGSSSGSSSEDDSYDSVNPSNNGSGTGDGDQDESQNKKKKLPIALIAGVTSGAVVVIAVVVVVVVFMIRKRRYVASSDGGDLPPTPEEQAQMEQAQIGQEAVGNEQL